MNSIAKKIYQSARLEFVLRWFIGIMFIYASWHKIIEPGYFAKIIYGYYLFPDVLINLMAIVLPYIELFSGLALVLGIYPRSAVLIIMGMLFSFILALGINLIRGHEFDCGCFSYGEQGYASSALQLMLRDIVYFAVSLQILFFNRERIGCILQTGGVLHVQKQPNSKLGGL